MFHNVRSANTETIEEDYQAKTAGPNIESIFKDPKKRPSARSEATLDNTAVLSHELLAPLGVLQNYTSILKETHGQVSYEREHEFILAIERISCRLKRQVQNLMEFYWQDKGLETVFRKVSLPLLVKSVVVEMQKEAPLHTLTAKLPHSMPSFCLGEQRLKLLLTNLIWNAIKYSPGGGPVEVVLRYVMKEEQLANVSPEQKPPLPPLPLAVVTVKDRGVGIAAQEVATLFKPFHRLQNGPSAPVGMGLGLYICDTIVRAHGGAIWVDSEPGKGSAFSFALPKNWGIVPQLNLPIA